MPDWKPNEVIPGSRECTVDLGDGSYLRIVRHEDGQVVLQGKTQRPWAAWNFGPHTLTGKAASEIMEMLAEAFEPPSNDYKDLERVYRRRMKAALDACERWNKARMKALMPKQEDETT